MAEATRESRLSDLYSDSWIQRLKSFVGRRYHDFGDWEGWFEEAHQNLALKIDRMPIEQEINDALVFAVFKNELVSVKRNRLGYPRPRAWLREFSDLGQDLFEWMCLRGLPRAKIIEMAQRKLQRSRQHENREDHTKLLIELTDTMIEKKECDGVRPATTHIDDESVGPLPDEAPSTEDNTDHAQISLVLSMLMGANTLDQDNQQIAQRRLQGLRESLGQNPLLNDMDILILRCYYFQGMSQNDIAKTVKLPLQKVVRQREAAIRRIRELLESNGLTRDTLEL